MKQRKRVRRGRRGDRAGWLVRLERKRRRGSELNRLRREEFDVLAVVCTPERIYMIPVEKLLVEESSEGLLRGAVIIKTDEDGSPTRADSLGAIERWIPYLNDFSMKSVTA